MPTYRCLLSEHIAESSRPIVNTSLEDNTYDLTILKQLITEGTLHVTHKDGHSLVTPGNSDFLPAIERTVLQAGKGILWHLLEVTASEANDAVTLLFTTLRSQDTPIHVRTSPAEEIDEFLMHNQVGPDSLASYTTSNILTKGEWSQAPLEGLIRNATRDHTNTAHHTYLPDGTGHLLLLTTCTWTNTPVKMDVMYGQEWTHTARKTATDRGNAGDILRQSKLQSAQQVLIDESDRADLHRRGSCGR